MSENNGKNEKSKPQEQRESRSRGFVELLRNIIKALFNSVVDLPQQEQYNKLKSTDRQQGTDSKGKSPEDLNPKAKLEVKEAAKGLKEKWQKSDTSNQSEIEVPNKTTTKEVGSSKVIER
ncbi:hypothetical protein [Wolbachia endosymbiont of Ctenocephalides felis wCfeJ]|uniref:hypothetical protein n=1 Tax=Wolbachia endosymbiont of Ctenocephalides felis wCfeJ TaxID=2732594 RepID=UPI0014489566|nr:hypothetical protein [Wolbachia endosymbiont of Ctenocephalides felis wCfeJ]WCR58457.1 MAG: hypothetical protein PG980_000929 [Wolbachia endosymbiont of Ctenocephalides felis wCfeJ]